MDGLELWVQRLMDAVGFRAVRQEANWPNVEAELGIELPKDYKELVEVFGGGVISRAAIIYTTGPGDSYDLVGLWRSLETSYRENPWSRSRYQPYEFYRPDSPLFQFDMTASEFIWRIACDEEFSHFGVAQHIQPPAFDDPEGNTYTAR